MSSRSEGPNVGSAPADGRRVLERGIEVDVVADRERQPRNDLVDVGAGAVMCPCERERLGPGLAAERHQPVQRGFGIDVAET
jgi:hypothetical protein